MFERGAAPGLDMGQTWHMVVDHGREMQTWSDILDAIAALSDILEATDVHRSGKCQAHGLKRPAELTYPDCCRHCGYSCLTAEEATRGAAQLRALREREKRAACWALKTAAIDATARVGAA